MTDPFVKLESKITGEVQTDIAEVEAVPLLVPRGRGFRRRIVQYDDPCNKERRTGHDQRRSASNHPI